MGDLYKWYLRSWKKARRHGNYSNGQRMIFVKLEIKVVTSSKELNKQLFSDTTTTF